MLCYCVVVCCVVVCCVVVCCVIVLLCVVLLCVALMSYCVLLLMWYYVVVSILSCFSHVLIAQSITNV